MLNRTKTMLKKIKTEFKYLFCHHAILLRYPSKCFASGFYLFLVFNFTAVMYCGAAMTCLGLYLPNKWELL